MGVCSPCVCVCTCLCLCVSIFVCLSLCVPIYVWLAVGVPLGLCLSVCSCICLSVPISLCLWAFFTLLEYMVCFENSCQAEWAGLGWCHIWFLTSANMLRAVKNRCAQSPTQWIGFLVVMWHLSQGVGEAEGRESWKFWNCAWFGAYILWAPFPWQTTHTLLILHYFHPRPSPWDIPRILIALFDFQAETTPPGSRYNSPC